MRGIIRPCRHTFSGDVREQWRRHLCGLCLTLRDEAGQGARVLTGYDVLLPSVLIDAQAGPSPTTKAGRCPLRGFATTEVLDSASPAMHLAAAAALLTGSAGIEDKVADRDIPGPTRPMASRFARRFQGRGEYVASSVGLDSRAVTMATERALNHEKDASASLDQILGPAGSAVAVVFGHTAVVARAPGNREALAEVGDAFGRLVHLLDAVTDRAADRRHRRYNPLDATGTDDHEALVLARRLHATILTALASSHFVDRSLIGPLFGPTLAGAIHRAFRTRTPVEGHTHVDSPSGGERGLAQAMVVGIAAGAMAQAAMWGRRRRDPDEDYKGGPHVVSSDGCWSSCVQDTACDCCGSCCCDACCSSVCP